MYNTLFYLGHHGMFGTSGRTGTQYCRWCAGRAQLSKRLYLFILSQRALCAMQCALGYHRHHYRLPRRSTSRGCNRWHPRWFDLPIGICLRLYRRFEHCVFLAGRQLWDRLFGVGTDCQCRRGDAGRTDLSGQYLVCL